VQAENYKARSLEMLAILIAAITAGAAFAADAPVTPAFL
jgi:hypothetical protein